MENTYEVERKHLIGLTAYSFAEACSVLDIDGWWISNMIELVKFADSYEFPIEEDGTIVMDVVFNDVELFAYGLAERIKNARPGNTIL